MSPNACMWLAATAAHVTPRPPFLYITVPQMAKHKWRVMNVALRFMSHWVFQLQGGIPEERKLGAPGQQFAIHRNQVLKCIEDLMGQMSSLKRLRHTIFTDFTKQHEIMQSMAKQSKDAAQEDLMLSMLYNTHQDVGGVDKMPAKDVMVMQGQETLRNTIRGKRHQRRRFAHVLDESTSKPQLQPSQMNTSQAKLTSHHHHPCSHLAVALSTVRDPEERARVKAAIEIQARAACNPPPPLPPPPSRNKPKANKQGNWCTLHCATLCDVVCTVLVSSGCRAWQGC